VKKSIDAAEATWFVRNVRHVCDGGRVPPRQQARDASLGDVDPEHAELAVDARCAPQRIGRSHVADQTLRLRVNPWRTLRASVP
jgi:hypothetical protein